MRQGKGKNMNWTVLVASLLPGVVLAAEAPWALMTEYQDNPIGIDVEAPRLSWKLGTGSECQVGYQIETDGTVQPEEKGAESIGVEWPGSRLKTAARHSWRVRVRDAKGELSPWSEPAMFVIGKRDFWRASWIGNGFDKQPAFEKSFVVSQKVTRATLFITAPGYYEAQLNGRKIGDKVLDPSPTQFDKRVRYSTYVLDGDVREGENVLKVLLGHGWYQVGAHAAWSFDAATWKADPKVLAELRLEYADGSMDTIGTDASWRVADTPVLYDDIREGEIIRNADEKPFARAPDSAPRVMFLPLGVRIEAQNHPAAKVCETVAPKKVVQLKDGSWMVVFPHNLAGWIRLAVRGQKKDALLKIRYDERVNADLTPAAHSWTLNRRNKSGYGEVRAIDALFGHPDSFHTLPDDPGDFQLDRFICSGRDETYEPRFTWNGFRYVWIRGWKGELKASDVTGCVVRTDFRRIASFECSDAAFNELHAMADRSYRSNFVNGFPTDCPHREKNGWTGDASMACETAQYCYENTAAYEEWLENLCDSQTDVGDLSAIVPTGYTWGYTWGNGPGWDSALYVIAWNLFRYRNDRQVLENVYPHLMKYIAFTDGKADEDGLVGHGLGDWLAPVRSYRPPERFTSSCFRYQSLRTAALMAQELGRRADWTNCLEKASFVREGLNRRYFPKTDGELAFMNGLQTAYAMALAFGIVDDSLVPEVRRRLVEACEANEAEITFGLFGSKYVFRELSNAGRTDLAYRMMMRDKAPSYKDWVNRGWTTLPEDFHDGSSRNHVMFTDFVAWSYQYLAGIRLAEDSDSTAAVPTGPNAFGEILIKPEPIPQLDWVKASVDTPRGLVKSEWKREGGRIRYAFTVPSGATAKLLLPGEEARTLGSGEHEF